MLKKTCWSLTILACAFMIFGCNTAIKVGDSVMGIQSGSFFYTDGILRTNYHASYDSVWNASVKAMEQMKAMNIEQDKKISKGIITAIIYDEEVRITVEYKEKDITQVAVRVGVSGSTLSSQFIHDKIKSNLIKKS